MKAKTIAMTLTALLMLIAQSAIAAEWVGYNAIVAPANSDIIVSVPFTLASEGEFTVANLDSANDRVTVSASMTSGAYANAYYVRFTSGAAAGLWSTISANGINSIDLASSDVFNEVAVGDVFRVYKHQTIGSVFTPRLKGKSYVDNTQVLIYENNLSLPQQNKSAASVATYLDVLSMWIGANGANTILEPGTQFVLRNNSSSALKLVLTGGVPDYPISILIPDTSTTGGDVLIGSNYPVNTPLVGAGFEASGRQVLFFSNSASGQNKSSDALATYISGLGWIGTGAGRSILSSAAIAYRIPQGNTNKVERVTINKPY